LSRSDWEREVRAAAQQQLKEVMSAGGQVTVFLASDVTDDQIAHLRILIQTLPGVQSVSFETREQAFERFKALFAGQPDIARNTSASALPESFRVSLSSDGTYAAVRKALIGKPGVYSVRDEQAAFQEALSSNQGRLFINHIETLPSIRTPDGRVIKHPTQCG